MPQSSANNHPYLIGNRQIRIIEVILIIGLASIPLLVSLPYRVNIFLSWEGAYRLYLGQIPYKDFGMPTGFVFWVIPAVFFKLFGPYLITLVKAQVFINIISGLSFRSILTTLGIDSGIRLACVLLFCISYSFFNFWPWYNHTVIVWELVALSFLLKYLLRERPSVWLLVASGGFLALSFFTKQDGGGLAIMVSLALLIYHCVVRRQGLPLLWFGLSLAIVLTLLILPFIPYDFGYWFNYGQFPHYSRLSLRDVLSEVLGASEWLKFYVLLVVLILFRQLPQYKTFLYNEPEMLHALLTLGILVEAVIFQVTSYTPPDNNIFFHSFAFAYLLPHLPLQINFRRLSSLATLCLLIMLWWSGVYWKYVERIVDRVFPATEEELSNEVVSKNTYVLATDTTVSEANWTFSDQEVFKKVYMPGPTVDGIKRVMQLDVIQNNPNPQVLNMTELTPLAYAIPYQLETGPTQPLWYHKGVGMFRREEDRFINKIKNKEYDLVLYEYIPFLNNFYPFDVRDVLRQQYRQVDTFLAPRRPANVNIEVYVKE